jgi:hypothetical protein
MGTLKAIHLLIKGITLFDKNSGISLIGHMFIL